MLARRAAATPSADHDRRPRPTTTTTPGATTTTTTTTTAPPTAPRPRRRSRRATSSGRRAHRRSRPRRAPTTSATRASCCPTSRQEQGARRYYLGTAGLTGKDVDTRQGRVPVRPGLDGEDGSHRRGQHQVGRRSPQQQFQSRSRSCSTASCSRRPRSSPTTGFTSFGGTVVISGNFTQGEAEGPRQAHQLRRAAGAAQAGNVESVSPTLGKDQLHAGIVAGHHRPRARRALHARLLPAARPRRDRRPRAQRHGVLHARSRILGRRRSASTLTPRRRHRHHRVGRCHRRLLRRVLRTTEGRGAHRQDGALVASTAAFTRSFRTIVAADLVSLIGAAVLYVLAIGSVRGLRVLPRHLDDPRPAGRVLLHAPGRVAAGAHAASWCACRASASPPASTCRRWRDRRDDATDRRRAPAKRQRHTLADLYHERTNFQFIKQLALGASSRARSILISSCAFAVSGLNLGIDFEGGTQWQFTVAQRLGVGRRRARRRSSRSGSATPRC